VRLSLEMECGSWKKQFVKEGIIQSSGVSNGGMKTLQNNFKRRAEATSKKIDGNVYCWQRRQGSSAQLEEAAWICCAVWFLFTVHLNFSVFNCLSGDEYLFLVGNSLENCKLLYELARKLSRALRPWEMDRFSWKLRRLLVKGRPIDCCHFWPDLSRWTLPLS